MLSWISYLLADLLVRILPARAADGLGVTLARLAYAWRVPARAPLEENLGRLLGCRPQADVRRLARASFENFALTIVDFLRLGHPAGGRLAGAVEVHGAEHLAAARASERGVILLSAHVGNWELGAAWLGTLGARVNLVARPHASPGVERFFARRRGAWGVCRLRGQPLWRGAGEALRRREWVALMADRVPGGCRRGRAGSACAWAAALSRRTGALVLPAVIVRLPGHRHAAYFERPLEPAMLREAGLLTALRGHVQAHAAQWYAFEALPGGLG